MMDRSPRALARWLPILALALIMESAVSIIFSFTVWNDGIFSMIRTFLHLPHVALLIGFGVAVRARTAGGEFRAASQRLLWGGFFAIAVTALTRFQDIYVWSNSAGVALVLQAAGNVLLGCAGPGIWGTAMAREEDLQSPRIATVGHAFRIPVVAGFGVYLAAEILRLVLLGPPGLGGRPSVAFATFTLLLFAGRGSLLASTLLFWRMPADEIAARGRAREVQALMLVWLAASSAALVFSALVGVFESQSVGAGNCLMLLWHAAVQATLTLIVVILVALSLEQPSRDYEPRRKRNLLPSPLPPAPTDNSPIDLP
jgi:hypothetical protein